ncbi:MAG: AraC family transcriptional regulator [Clostridia bacterium]|nr:AraC family transcriptional regulator [Clostridia bacterium]
MAQICLVNNDFENNFSKNIFIDHFGIEYDSQAAHWGPGQRMVYIIHFILSGKGFFNGNAITEGQGFLISPSELHEYYSDDKNPWKYLWVMLMGNQVEHIFSMIKTDKNNIFTFQKDIDFQKTILDIQTHIEKNATINSLSAYEYYFRLLNKCENQNAKTDQTKTQQYVELAKKYIKCNFHRNISINDIANHIGISANYLTNLFLNNGEKSPKNYLTELRIYTACNMLKNTDMLIKEIAVSVGYNDPLQFSTFFKNHIGLSPLQYRNQNIW